MAAEDGRGAVAGEGEEERQLGYCTCMHCGAALVTVHTAPGSQQTEDAASHGPLKLGMQDPDK